MKWETKAGLFAAPLGLAVGCGLVPSGIGFGLVFLVVGARAVFERRRARSRHAAGGAVLPSNTRTYPTIIGRVEVSRPTAHVIGVFSVGAGIGLIGHLLGFW